MSVSTSHVEALAAEIGEQVYIDVARWHLFLSDAKLARPLAEALLPLVEDDRIQEKEVVDILAGFMVSLGGGQRQLPLSDLVPATCRSTLLDVLDRFRDEL
jgi:hypothetical protein